MAKGQGQGVVLGYLRYVLGFDSLAFQEGLGEADKRLKAAQKSIQKTADGFTSIGKSLTTYVTLPVAGAAAAILKMGGDFESSMNKVAISTNGTAAELKAMNDLALKLGKDTVFGATDAADAMDELAKNGLSAKQILEGAATAAVNLASAAGSELTPASKAISDVMAQFKIGAKDLPMAVNQITGAVNQSKLDFVDFSQGIAQAGGVAGSVGVSFQDFNAVLAGTSSLFASGSDAGTSFKTFLLALPGNSKPAIEAIKQYGLQFYDAQGNLRSMADIAEQLRTKLGGLNDQAKTDVLKTIFGTDAMRTAIGLMDQGAKGIDTIKAKIAETDAAAQSAKRLQGFNGQMEQLKGAVETLAITIAQSGILEFVTQMVTSLGNFVDGLAETNPELLKWGTIIGGLAAVLGPVIIGIGAVVSAFGTLLPIIGPVAAAIGTVVSVITAGIIPALGGLIVALSPVLIPLAAVAAAVGAVYLAWKNWDLIGPILAKLYNGVKSWIVDKLGRVWDWLQGKIKAVGQWFFELYDAVVGHSYIPDMVDEIGQNMARLDKLMVDPAQKTTQKAGDAFRAMAQRVGGIIDELFPKTAQLRDEMAKLIALQNDKTLSPSVRQAALDAQINRVLNAQDAAKEETSPALGNITAVPGALDDAWATVSETAKRAADSLQVSTAATGQAFVDMANKSLNALSNLANAIKGGGVLDILSAAFNAFGAIAGTGLLGSKMKTGFSNFTPISGFRAKGGPVSAGKSYVVGERGPELFTASRSGYVHANGSEPGRSGNKLYFDLSGAVMTQDLLAQMNAIGTVAMVQGGNMGSSGAQIALARKQSRTIP
ncbi:phage tail tape measure protein [Sphingobium chungbukense]|uniref:Phage tail tape measure protein domain-containing protein n=1 Tax=Sphingobium chungbukense TaxID=56193 RepID=A0A0M3AUJ3_9SPHN|nr:phage tail tape measure protein [Sphingobium chungbukense]KKW93867.1 hypothetical protein YP76_04210 [Sphingobium chungbukense]